MENLNNKFTFKNIFKNGIIFHWKGEDELICWLDPVTNEPQGKRVTISEARIHLEKGVWQRIE